MEDGMGTVHHGAMDTQYGLLIRHEDGSWHPYSSMTGMDLERAHRLLEHPPYGLSLDNFRIVKWTALALCTAPDCKGHDDPDWQCPPALTDREVDDLGDALASGVRKLARGGWRDK